MNNFKVGSKVIVVKKIDRNPEQKYEIGSVGDEIVCEHHTEGVNNYLVPNTIYTENWLKLVARKSMKKSAEHIREEILRIDTLIEKSKKNIEEAEKKRESFVEQLREKGFLLYEKDIVDHGNPDLSIEDIHVGDTLILTGRSYNSIISCDSVVVVRYNDKLGIPLFVRCVESGETDWVKLEDVKRA